MVNTKQKSNFIFEHPDITSTFNFIVTLDVQEMKEIKHKREITEDLQFSNCYKEIIRKDSDFKNSLGNILKEFLNNFDEIYDLFKGCKEKISHISTLDINIFNKCTPLKYLEQLCLDIKNSINLKHSSPLIENEIYTFIKKDLVSTERLFRKEINLKSEIDTFEFYQKESIQFINHFLNNIKDIKDLVDISFTKPGINTDESSTNLSYKFRLKKLNIPKTEFKFDIDNEIVTYQYIYKISSIEELMNITIYHLVLNDSVFVQCLCCHKYFIPFRNNTIYCQDTIWKNNKNQNVTCKQKSKENYHKKRESEYIKEYNKIYKKIKKSLTPYNDKSEFQEKLKIQFELFKTKYKELCKFYKTDKDNPKFEKKLTKLFQDMNEQYEVIKNRFLIK